MVHCALMIGSSVGLEEELCKIKHIFWIRVIFRMFICRFFCIKFQNSILLLYMVLTSVLFTWNSFGLERMVDQIVSYISECYWASKLWIVFFTRDVFPSFEKYKGHPFSNSSVVYFKRLCNADYVEGKPAYTWVQESTNIFQPG